MSVAENDELIEATVEKIVATKTEGEPFDTVAKFWSSGFHPRAFEFLEDIVLGVFKSKWFDEWKTSYLQPDRRNSIIFADLFCGNVEQRAHHFANTCKWTYYPSLRKEVLRRLHRTSFQMSGPKVHDENTPLVRYAVPSWLTMKKTEN